MKDLSLKLKNKGFTLIELLVVMAIIAVLAGVSAFGLQNAFESSRDGQRRSDLKQYQSVLENFAHKNGTFYPASTSPANVTTVCPWLGLTSALCVNDPVSGNYQYRTSDGSTDGSATATRYLLWADLEVGGHWVVCSNGKSGETANPPSSASCPL